MTRRPYANHRFACRDVTPNFIELRLRQRAPPHADEQHIGLLDFREACESSRPGGHRTPHRNHPKISRQIFRRERRQRRRRLILVFGDQHHELLEGRFWLGGEAGRSKRGEAEAGQKEVWFED